MSTSVAQIRSLAIIVAGCFIAMSCGSVEPAATAPSDTTVAPTTPSVADLSFVSGNVVYQQDEFSHDYGDEPILLDGAHAVISICTTEAAMQDVACDELASARIDDITDFPFAYSIDIDDGFDPKLDYFLNAKVSRTADDFYFYVGDLASEWVTMVDKAGAIVDIEVSGLEDCRSEGGGGSCTERVRGVMDTCPDTQLANEADDAAVLATGAECFFAAYDSGESVRWLLEVLTVEGDPIYYHYSFDGTTVEIITDTRQDSYGSPDATMQRCDTVARTSWIPEGSGCIDA